MSSKYKKPIEEIADAFVKLSGDLDALKSVLSLKTGRLEQPDINLKSASEPGQRQFYTEWSQTEDMALFKDVNSNDYEILIKTKGLTEIEKRKNFLSSNNTSKQIQSIIN